MVMVDNMIEYVKIFRDLLKRLLELVGEYSKLTEHKVIKSFEISLTMTTENIDYLRINLENTC